jgi:hypothetical protein
MLKPPAILTIIKESPETLDQSLIKAYREAHYYLQPVNETVETSLLFHFEHPDPALMQELIQFKVQTFAILTACNPGSQLLAESENRARNAALKSQLLLCSRLLRPAFSCSPQGDWQEPGFWALDIAWEQALRLGRAFGQNALIWWAARYTVIKVILMI